MPIVKCSGLKKTFEKRGVPAGPAISKIAALDGVSISIEKGEIFGLVGESGCGKTTLGKVILALVKPDSGSVEVSSDRVQAVFQDSYNSLDPKMRISDILAEGLIIKGESAEKIRKLVQEMAEMVRLPQSSLSRYPHQFSGGERQRIAIARAVLTEPELIICDEPVSSLDVTIQAEILDLLEDVQQRFRMAYLFISHDLRVVRRMASRVAVMREGRIIEEGPVDHVYSNPTHPYTKQLLLSIPDLSL